MNITIYQIDAFTSERFRGNPAAVVLLSEKMPDQWMQSVSREMNLSETAFLLKQQDFYNLRWFTPKTEVPLCGHATLASAHVLFESGIVQPDEIAKFITASGQLSAKLCDGWIELNFPELSVSQTPVTKEISRALGFEPGVVFASGGNLLVEVKESEFLEMYLPIYFELAKLPFQGLILTARGKNNGFDFISRYFAPRVGIDEDPVTGSAHCSLAPYWAEKLNKQKLIAYQASNRGGILKLELDGGRVLIQGQAVTVFSGDLKN